MSATPSASWVALSVSLRHPSCPPLPHYGQRVMWTVEGVGDTPTASPLYLPEQGRVRGTGVNSSKTKYSTKQQGIRPQTTKVVRHYHIRVIASLGFDSRRLHHFPPVNTGAFSFAPGASPSALHCPRRDRPVEQANRTLNSLGTEMHITLGC